MKSKIIIAAAAVLLAGPAWAGCEFAPIGSNCSTDRYGNTYRTEQNLGGGYNTYRNGALHSQTQQNLSGGYTETFRGGNRRYYDSDPYARRENCSPYSFGC